MKKIYNESDFDSDYDYDCSSESDRDIVLLIDRDQYTFEESSNEKEIADIMNSCKLKAFML